MRSILAILRREIKSYFVSPIAYVVIVIFLGMIGLTYRSAVFAYVGVPEFAAEANGINIQNFLIRGLSLWFQVGMLFCLPALSMRLLSEERKGGTAELLMTSPLTTWQIVLGKYLGTLFILATILILTIPEIFWLEFKAEPEWGAIGIAYLAYFLFGALILAIGLFASALSENQIVALLITVAIALPMWLVDLIVPFTAPPWDKILGGFSVSLGIRAYILGLFDSHYVVLPLGLIFIFLFLCTQVLDSNRWR